MAPDAPGRLSLGPVAVSPCSLTFTVDAYDRTCAASFGLDFSTWLPISMTFSQLDTWLVLASCF
jgi:hypothetical protein